MKIRVPSPMSAREARETGAQAGIAAARRVANQREWDAFQAIAPWGERRLPLHRIDADHVALGCFEFPKGYVFWVKVKIDDLPPGAAELIDD